MEARRDVTGVSGGGSGSCSRRGWRALARRGAVLHGVHRRGSKSTLAERDIGRSAARGPRATRGRSRRIGGGPTGGWSTPSSWSTFVEGDQRPGVLRPLGMPCLLVGTWHERGFPRSRTDDAARSGRRWRTLWLGHRRIARVSGPARLLQPRRSGTAAMLAQCQRCRGRARSCSKVTTPTAAGSWSSTRAAASALASTRPAIVYDNDVMAVAGLRPPGPWGRGARPAQPRRVGRLDPVSAGVARDDDD